MRRVGLRRLAIVSLFIGIYGCAAVRGPQREVVLRIDPPVPSATAEPSLGGRLSLSPVTAAGSASGRRYTYVDPSAPREVRSAATLFWEEPPPVMVQRAFEAGLSERLGQPVLTVQEAPAGQRRLSVMLDRFEEASGAMAAAVIAVRTTLLDSHTRELIAAARYCVREPIRGGAPTERSAAFEAALNKLMDHVARDLANRTPEPQPSDC